MMESGGRVTGISPAAQLDVARKEELKAESGAWLQLEAVAS